MKLCPKCNLNYSDDTLEYCLEDGTRLIFRDLPETPTLVRPNTTNVADVPTINLPLVNQEQNIHTNQLSEAATASVGVAAEETSLANLSDERTAASAPSSKILEIAPVVVSLAHNWWQWVYLNNQYYYSFGSYVLSANFLMWLLLLAAGAVLGLFVLKRGSNKSFAILGLVILAINLLLFLVPKR